MANVSGVVTNLFPGHQKGLVAVVNTAIWSQNGNTYFVSYETKRYELIERVGQLVEFVPAAGQDVGEIVAVADFQPTGAVIRAKAEERSN